jgi:hypothetical protein
MGLIKDEPDSSSEECVPTLEDGTEDGSIKVEEAIIKFGESDTEVEAADIKVEELVDIKEENPEVIKFPPIKTEPEVSEWNLCVRQQQFVLPQPFTATEREHGKYSLSVFVYVLCILYSLILITNFDEFA